MPERDTAIATADAGVAQAEQILAQMLVLARIDQAASDRLKSGSADLAMAARDETMEHVLAARAAGIDRVRGDKSATVRGDETLLRELVRNLIQNTIAYAGAGAEATVRVTGGAENRRGSPDNGRGVAAHKIERLTKRFERGGNSGHGAGLGLAIVEEIAALFGGRLSISSSEGSGFSAVVRFPAVAVS